MTATSLLLFILFIQLVHFLGTWKLYVAAGRKAWEAAIPVYNGIVLMKIINRPTWWIFFLFVPVINLFLFVKCTFIALEVATEADDVLEFVHSIRMPSKLSCYRTIFTTIRYKYLDMYINQKQVIKT